MQKIASQEQEEKGLTEKSRARLDDLLNEANSGGAKHLPSMEGTKVFATANDLNKL